ncbi:MAG: hypothetical protein ABI162_05595 [Luteolibacter sp.]
MQNSSKTARRVSAVSCGLALCGFAPGVLAGPYSAAQNDPANPYDAPIPGFVGPDGIGKARLDSFNVDGNGDPIYQNPNNFVNPLFFGWADSVVSYDRADLDLPFSDTILALGPVTGDNFDVVSLGDLTAPAIGASAPPGTITVELAKPIKDLDGADFVVFENGHITQSNQGGAGVGGIFAELANVWVSANGVDFVKFPTTSLTAASVGMYGSLDPTNLRNLAGKHLNSFGNSWGTPFDLAQVGLAQITHIRIVDIPGNGAFLDQSGHPIYDPWQTFGSGGFDLEAVGAISTQTTYADWTPLANLATNARGKANDPDGDGLSNLLEYAFGGVPWLSDSADVGPKIRLITVGNDAFAEFTFLRDERLTDLVYEVQVSSSLSGNTWTTIASSTGGGVTLPKVGHQPVISETSASAIASVGVVRRVTVRDEVPIAASSRRFLRVKVIEDSALLGNP